MSDKAHFVKLITEQQRLVNKLVFTYADSPEDRQDLQQEILYQAWKSFSGFRGEAKFSTWLYRVGIRVGVAWVNQHKKNLPRAEGNYSREPVTNQTDNELMESVIRVLNMVERSLLLCLLEGYTYEETADLMGISYENVRVKIHRIRKKLRDYGIEKLVE